MATTRKPSTRSSRPRRQQLTADERDARRQKIEQLRRASAALLTSEGWQRWLRTRARFHRYSLNNTLLIALQCPEASYVAGFRRWLELGRCVRKGEKAIRILAPVTYRKGNDDEAGEEREETLVAFRLAAVFDVRQTEPLPGIEPAALEPPAVAIEGESHAHLLAPLEAHAVSLGFTVSYQPLEAGQGQCSYRERSIVVEESLPGNARVATLIHELAHAHGIGYRDYSRAEAELIVESVACIVCGGAGLDTIASSVSYLSCWNEQEAPETIARLAATIDEIARRIESSLSASLRSTEAAA